MKKLFIALLMVCGSLNAAASPQQPERITFENVPVKDHTNTREIGRISFTTSLNHVTGKVTLETPWVMELLSNVQDICRVLEDRFYKPLWINWNCVTMLYKNEEGELLKDYLILNNMTCQRFKKPLPFIAGTIQSLHLEKGLSIEDRALIEQAGLDPEQIPLVKAPVPRREGTCVIS